MPEYEPGLGCPAEGCKAGFYTPKERTEHIRENHPDLFAGPTADMVFVAKRAGVSLGDVFSDRRRDRAEP